jgi:hypothetical protein
MTETQPYWSDHHRFDLQGTQDKLGLMLSYAYQEWYGRATQARFYTVDETRENEPPRLILFWHEDPSLKQHPIFAMDAGASQGFVQAWLKSLDRKVVGREPDTDGSTKIGVRVYNERYGFVMKSAYAFVAIEPVWLVFGK